MLSLDMKKTSVQANQSLYLGLFYTRKEGKHLANGMARAKGTEDNEKDSIFHHSPTASSAMVTTVMTRESLTAI